MEVRAVHDEGEQAAAYAIRHQVFVAEQQVPAELEVDEHDADAEHLVAVHDGRVVGTVRLVVETAGPYAGLAHLGRLAVLPTARRLGLGAALVAAVEHRAAERGLPEVVLTAQVDAIGWYETRGYVAEGPVFDDAGIDHRWMRKPLAGRHAERPAPGPGTPGPVAPRS